MFLFVNALIWFVAILFAIVGLTALLVWLFPPILWYVAAFLAKFDFIFTTVPESYFKEVVRFGGHRKTIMAKTGHKIDDEGSIVKLEAGESPESSLPGGLRIIGWPLIDKIYTREMKFLKSLSNGEIKSYSVENVNVFLAKVDYPYAIPFVNCEDKNNLPLGGHATLLAHIMNPQKSLFATANFFDTLVGLVLAEIRQCLKSYTFDELKGMDNLDKIMWEALKAENPGGHLGSTGSVIEEMRDIYGVGIVALRIVNIDPPPEQREATLTKWKAERQADAAKFVAEKDAEETEGRVLVAVAKANGLSREELENIIAANPELKGLPAEQGGLKEDFAHARDVMKRDRAGDGLEDIRVGNVDGTPLEPITGVLASLLGLKQRQSNRRSKSNTGGSGQGGGQGSKGKSDRETAAEIFKQTLSWPSWWDPVDQKRK